MAQERCIRRTVQFGRLWELGEVRTIEKFDEEGSPVESAHFRIVGKKDRIDPDKVYHPEEVAERLREVGSRDKTTAINNALRKLDPEDDTHWTSSGLPSVQKLHVLTDFDVTRAEIQTAAPDFDRRSWKETQDIEADTSNRRQ